MAARSARQVWPPWRWFRGGPDASAALVGVAMGLIAAVTWALGTVMLKLGAVEADVIAVNAIRMPTGALALLLYRQLWLAPRYPLPQPSLRLRIEIAAYGLLGTGVGGALYVLSAQEIGAGRTATLGATAPLFAAPLAALILKEAIGPRVLAGIVVSVTGIWLLF